MHYLTQPQQIVVDGERSVEDDGDGCAVMGRGILVSFPQRFITGCSENPRVLPFSPVSGLIRDSKALKRMRECRRGADVVRDRGSYCACS